MRRRGPTVLDPAKKLTPEQRDKFFECVRSLPRLRDRVLLTCAFNGALRGNELLHLKVSSFDCETNTVQVIPSKKAGERRIKQDDGTFKTQVRPLPKPSHCPLIPEVVALVQSYINTEGLDSESWLFPGRSGPCGVVMFGCPGGHLNVRTLQRVTDKVLMAAGQKVPSRNSHVLRHSRLMEVYASSDHDLLATMQFGRLDDYESAMRYAADYRLSEIAKKVGGRV